MIVSELKLYTKGKNKGTINSPRNIAKFTAARKKLGDKFKVLTEDDIEVINLELMYELYLNKDLVFYKKYEEKFIKYYKENSKEVH